MLAGLDFPGQIIVCFDFINQYTFCLFRPHFKNFFRKNLANFDFLDLLVKKQNIFQLTSDMLN